MEFSDTLLAAAQQAATANMEKSLGEMASRIHLVAMDKPMAIRVAPITLTEVQNWISSVPQVAPAPALTATKSSTSTGAENK